MMVKARLGNILVVEDDQDLSEIMRLKLHGEGYEVTCALSLEAALDAVRELKYDLIFLDLVLGSESGVDLIDEVRADTDHRNYSAPIAVLSGHLDEDKVRELRDFIQEGMRKPVPHAEILRIAGRYAGKK